ncbi:MAG: hypothetical protein ACRDVW_04635, partial [Acidimicrobiales bacterium]
PAGLPVPFAAGPRHTLNGGVIGTLLDCHGFTRRSPTSLGAASCIRPDIGHDEGGIPRSDADPSDAWPLGTMVASEDARPTSMAASKPTKRSGPE